MSNKYFFGIEGGGSNSRLALTDEEGKVLTTSEGRSTNIYSVTKEDVFDNLSALLDSALESAGISKEDLAAGCIGSAGLGRDAEKILFQEFFDVIIRPEFPVMLCGDGEILLCGGLENLEGYCLISGTGSIALGRSAKGDLVRSGGHGYLLGDEGSAAWIGWSAIARILRSMENRDLATDMSGAILEATGLSRIEEAIHYIHYSSDKVKVATLAPVVTAAARKDDPLALDILRTGAAELALLVKSVVDRSPWINRKELVLAGGVLKNDEILVKMLKENISRDLPALLVSSPKGTALQGACMLAISMVKQANL
jgi:N-acetylglucosamine kinase-like BadF-type ATPase